MNTFLPPLSFVKLKIYSRFFIGLQLGDKAAIESDVQIQI